MNKHAKTRSELVRRIALSDHPVALHTSPATTSIDAPYMSIGAFLLAPLREPIPHGNNNRRFTTIDPDFVAQTADHAIAFEGDSFSRSFRMDAPLMPKTGDFKIWKRDFLSFLSYKAAALIP
jgi:hypothetical protein